MVEVITGTQIVDIKWEDVVEMRKSKIAVLQMMGRSTEDEDEEGTKTVNMMKEENKKEQGFGGSKASIRGGNGSYGNARGRSDYGRSEYGIRGGNKAPCHQWTYNQRCRFGDECRFEHDKTDINRKKEKGKSNMKGVHRVHMTQQSERESEDEDEEDGDSDESDTRKRKVLEKMISTAQEQLTAMKSPKKKTKA
jgi:hypothetical protein